VSKQQLSLFQRGEDLPLFNREPDEYPEDYLEDSETGLPEWDSGPDLGPVAPEGWTPLDGCPACGCEDVRIGHGGPGYPATYATCQRCGWQDVLTEPDEHAQLRQWIDDPHSIAWCDVCSAQVPPGATLCRPCLNEATQELDHERARGAITFTEYQAELGQLIAKAGLNRCTYCGEPVSITLDGEIIHAECKRERNVREGFEVADWGDGSISPDEEQRRAALDHRGQP